MARDLIPPPSPAGRPMPDGTPNLIELPPEPPTSPAVTETGPPPGPSEFRNRFGFLLGALAGVFIAAVAVAGIVAYSNRDTVQDEGLAPNWSSWQPTDSSISGGASEIAAHVSAEYKHPDGRQLVGVAGSEMPDDIRLQLRPASGPLVAIDGHRVVYQMDGFGKNGTIKGGEPSTTRMRVLQREGLELALYTFRYLPESESVTIVLPTPQPSPEQAAAAAAKAAQAAKAAGLPAPTATPTATPESLPALFYRPGDLKPQLQVPLERTLSAKVPSTEDYTGPEADTVATLTLSNLFEFSSTSPAGDAYLLDRPDTP